MSDTLTWLHRAKCRPGAPTSTDPEFFFPLAETMEREVAKFCVDCPVIQECLLFALESHCLEGVFGGTTGAQRRAMLGLRSRGKVPNPQSASVAV